MEIRKVLILMTLILVSVASLGFVYQSNDHLECETTIEKYTNAEGSHVTTKTHICK
jgi:hypothetical protein